LVWASSTPIAGPFRTGGRSGCRRGSHEPVSPPRRSSRPRPRSGKTRSTRCGRPWRQIDAVVVGSGDGTVGTVVRVVAGAGVPLGILPLGTLHQFAKDLGLPLDIDGAVQVIAAARTRDVDVAEVNGRVFINNASIGIHPCMVVDRDRRRSTAGLSKGLAMSLAFLRMLWRFPRRRLSIRTEGWTAPRRTPCLLIGNNEYGIELLTLGRRNRLDAGELWLFVATPRNSRAAVVRGARRVRRPEPGRGLRDASGQGRRDQDACEPDARGARWRGGDDAAAPELPCPVGGAPRVRPRTAGGVGKVLPCG
jgi:hypothetical protein